MHRRIGRNTAISYPLWMQLLLPVIAIGLIAKPIGDLIGMALLGRLVVAVFVLWLAYHCWTLYIHVRRHADLTPSCKRCAARAGRLHKQEAGNAAREARAIEMARLNRKHQA